MISWFLTYLFCVLKFRHTQDPRSAPHETLSNTVGDQNVVEGKKDVQDSEGIKEDSTLEYDEEPTLLSAFGGLDIDDTPSIDTEIVQNRVERRLKRKNERMGHKKMKSCNVVETRKPLTRAGIEVYLDIML